MEKSIGSLLGQIEESFGLKGVKAGQYSPLALAYLGDGVYEIIIRTLLMEQGNAPANKLHKRASSFVKAEAQAGLLHAIEMDLTEEERSIYKRGRNAKSATSAKNASVIDYRVATGFEALMGYLYMDNQMGRALELVKAGLERSGRLPISGGKESFEPMK